MKILLLLLPLFLGGILHMIVVKLNFFPQLKKPLWEKMFGKNKTYRGFLIMPLVTIPGSYFAYIIDQTLPKDAQLGLINYSYIVMGICLGLAYVIFELPNSYIKRKAGIPPGKSPQKNKLLFFLGDQLDSTVGCAIVYKIFLDVPWSLLLITPFAGALLHSVTNVILWSLKIRKEPL